MKKQLKNIISIILVLILTFSTSVAYAETPVNISDDVLVSLDQQSYEYTGATIKPVPKVLYKGEYLKLNEDFSCQYEGNPVDAGSHYVNISFIGKYIGSASCMYQITPKELKQNDITAKITDSKKNHSENFVYFIYTGEEIKPEVEVYVKGTKLVKDKDYDVSYLNNVEIAQEKGDYAYATVNLKGNYSGSVSCPFYILSGDFGWDLPQTIYIYDGTPKTPEPIVYRVTPWGERVLVDKSEYECAYENNTEVGNDCFIYCTFKDKTKFDGCTGFADFFEIVPADFLMSLSKTSYYYDGTAKKPTVTVYQNRAFGKKYIISPKEYTVSYKNNVNVGIATVSVDFKRPAWKSLTANYKIASDNSKCTLKISKSSFTYNGKVQKPTVTVKNSKGKILKKNTDYTLTISNSKNVGTYTVKVKMKGNYTGSYSATYKIYPAGTTLKSVTSDWQAFKVTVNKRTTQTTGYQIQYATDSKFSKGVSSYRISNKYSSKTFTKKGNKKTYYVRVRTYKKINDKTYYSNWSGYKKVTTKGINSTSLKSLTANYYGFTAKWSKPKYISGYQLQYSKKSNMSDSKTITINNTSTLSKKVENLTGNKKYYVRIRTFKKVKQNKKTTTYYGNWSSIKAVTTKYHKKPDAPVVTTKMIDEKDTPWKVKASWKAVPNVTGYQINLEDFPNELSNESIARVVSEGKNTINTTKTTHTYSKLKDNYIYGIGVRSYKTVNGKNIYSDWTVVVVRTKFKPYSTYLTDSQKQWVLDNYLGKFHECTLKYYNKDVTYILKEVQPRTTEAKELKRCCVTYHHYKDFASYQKATKEDMDHETGLCSLNWSNADKGETYILYYMWEDIDGESYFYWCQGLA